MEPTQPSAAEQMTIEDIINGISTKKSLIAFADKIMGFKIDESLTAPVIKEELIKIYNNRAENAEKENVESAKQMASDDDPMVQFKFYNVENPGQDHEFTSDGGRGLKNTKFELSGKVPKYHFYHGKVHTAPFSIMNMLNNLAVPFSKFDIDPDTNMVRGKIAGTKPRFLCQIILDKEQIKALGAKSA